MPRIIKLAGRTRTLLIGAVVALLGVSMAPGAALATDGRPAYAQQARAAGLTATQATELQTQVDGYLAKTGGVQTAANRIEYPTGAILLVTLPTEKSARDLSAARASAADSTCDYYWLCLWSGPEFTGDVIRLYHCNVWQAMPWRTRGSWINNQTAGTYWAELEEYGHTLWLYPAWSYAARDWNWDPIVDVKAC